MPWTAEKRREYNRVWRINNPGYLKEWRAKNRPPSSREKPEHSTTNKVSNKEKKAAYMKKWYAANKSRCAANSQKYLSALPEEEKTRRRKLKAAYMQEWRKKHPQVVAARTAVGNAIQAGRLIRPTECSECKESCKPQAHHYCGYAPQYALAIVWLCNRCHLSAHGRLT